MLSFLGVFTTGSTSILQRRIRCTAIILLRDINHFSLRKLQNSSHFGDIGAAGALSDLGGGIADSFLGGLADVAVVAVVVAVVAVVAVVVVGAVVVTVVAVAVFFAASSGFVISFVYRRRQKISSGSHLKLKRTGGRPQTFFGGGPQPTVTVTPPKVFQGDQTQWQRLIFWQGFQM